MASTFRKRTGWLNYFSIAFICFLLIVIDTQTDSLNGIRNGLSVAISPVRMVASLPSRFERWVSGRLDAEPNIQLAYDNLRSEYFKLRSEMLLLRSLQDENKTLRSLLDASQRLKEEITLAELVNVQIDRDQHSILVGRGLRHGVYSGQAVLDDLGVIGQVTEVMPFNSNVMLITDPGHAIPVQVKRTGQRTLVYGTGSIASMRVPFLNQNADIEVGDILLSSGLGGRFPSGYPVAEVEEVKLEEGESFMNIVARPIAKLDRSNHVLLLSRMKSNEEAEISSNESLIEDRDQESTSPEGQ